MNLSQCMLRNAMLMKKAYVINTLEVATILVMQLEKGFLPNQRRHHWGS